MSGRASRSTEPVPLPGHLRHGTYHVYCHYRCGCDPCRAACAEVTRRRRTRYQASRVMRRGRWFTPNAPHGTRHGYDFYGCRCSPCTVARSERAGLLATTPWARRNRNEEKT